MTTCQIIMSRMSRRARDETIRREVGVGKEVKKVKVGDSGTKLLLRSRECWRDGSWRQKGKIVDVKKEFQPIKLLLSKTKVACV